MDLVIEEGSRLLLVEVKDFVKTNPGTKSVGEVVTKEWVPKARDSYSYLHLMERDDRPITYIVLVCEPQNLGQFEELDTLGAAILRRCRHEAEEPWRRQYIEECVAVTPVEWDRHFPQYRLTLEPPTRSSA